MNRHPLNLFLNRLRRRFPSFALADDGHLLMSAASDPADAGLLPLAMENAARYFPLSVGDLVLLKDPFAGGPGRDGIAIVTCWRKGNDANAGLLAATTVHLPSLRGLRLPPAPLRLGGEINAGVVDALGPAGNEILRAAKELDDARTHLQRPALADLFSRKSLQEAQSRKQDHLAALFADLPESEVETDLKLPTGETLRVKLHSDGKHLEFDFSGTSPGRALQIPLAAATGILYTAVRERLGLEPVVDALSAALMPLSVPNGCFLNAKSGDCERGLDEATAWLQWTVEMLFQKWDKRKPRGLVNPFDLRFSLDFGDQRVLSLRLPSGSAAREDNEGTTFVQQRDPRDRFSLEKLEEQWPLRLCRVDERASLHGKGKFPGGRGLHLQFEVLAPAKLRWSPTPFGGRVKTEKNQSAFDAPIVHLERAGAAVEKSPIETHDVLKGDIITLLSGSGGGLV